MSQHKGEQALFADLIDAEVLELVQRAAQTVAQSTPHQRQESNILPEGVPVAALAQLGAE